MIRISDPVKAKTRQKLELLATEFFKDTVCKNLEGSMKFVCLG